MFIWWDKSICENSEGFCNKKRRDYELTVIIFCMLQINTISFYTFWKKESSFDCQRRKHLFSAPFGAFHLHFFNFLSQIKGGVFCFSILLSFCQSLIVIIVYSQVDQLNRLFDELIIKFIHSHKIVIN